MTSTGEVSKNAQSVDVVVVFGQIRDDYISLDKIYEAFSKRPNTLIFLTTWRLQGKKVDGLYGPSQLKLVLGEEIARAIPYHTHGAKFYTCYPGLRERFVASSNTIDEEELKNRFPDLHLDIEDECMNLEFSRAYGDLNSKRLLYKWWRGVSVVEKYAASHNLLLGKCMLVRSDRYPLNVDLFDIEMDSNSLIIDNWGEITSGDMLLLSSFQKIKQVTRLFNYCDLEPVRPWSGIHRELHNHIVSSGLHPKVNIDMKLRNPNQIGLFSKLARDYFFSEDSASIPNSLYVRRSLEAIEASKAGNQDIALTSLNAIRDLKIKNDVTVFITEATVFEKLGQIDLAIISIVAAIVMAARTNYNKLTGLYSLRPNDGYLYEKLNEIYKSWKSVFFVSETEQAQFNFYNLMIAKIQEIYGGDINPLNDSERSEGYLSVLVKPFFGKSET